MKNGKEKCEKKWQIRWEYKLSLRW